jgi:hypothetical protein
MNRFRLALIGAVLVAGQALVVGCSPGEKPSAEVTVSESPDSAGSSFAGVDRDVQQRVKNLCVEDLQTQAAGETSKLGQLRSTKVRLVRVKYLGDVTPASLQDGVAGYELGIEFVYKIGNDDSKTGTKICGVNLADSSVTWQSKSGP